MYSRQSTSADVECQVREIVDCLNHDSGFVFNAIHNILAEVEPEKIIAMYRTAGLACEKVSREQIEVSR